eukprot:Gb_29190 [translate_table: standard]
MGSDLPFPSLPLPLRACIARSEPPEGLSSWAWEGPHLSGDRVMRMVTTTGCKIEGNGSNIYVRTLCEQGRLKEALHILHLADNHVDSFTYACLLQGCINQETLAKGKLVHTYMTVKGFNLDIHLGTVLVTMDAKCNSLANARRVLDQMLEQNVVSWTAMIAAYTKHGDSEATLKLFYQMQ